MHTIDREEGQESLLGRGIRGGRWKNSCRFHLEPNGCKISEKKAADVIIGVSPKTCAGQDEEFVKSTRRGEEVVKTSLKSLVSTEVVVHKISF
jgi:hypothetical protein